MVGSCFDRVVFEMVEVDKVEQSRLSVGGKVEVGKVDQLLRVLSIEMADVDRVGQSRLKVLEIVVVDRIDRLPLVEMLGVGTFDLPRLPAVEKIEVGMTRCNFCILILHLGNHKKVEERQL